MSSWTNFHTAMEMAGLTDHLPFQEVDFEALSFSPQAATADGGASSALGSSHASATPPPLATLSTPFDEGGSGPAPSLSTGQADPRKNYHPRTINTHWKLTVMTAALNVYGDLAVVRKYIAVTEKYQTSMVDLEVIALRPYSAETKDDETKDDDYTAHIFKIPERLLDDIEKDPESVLNLFAEVVLKAKNEAAEVRRRSMLQESTSALTLSPSATGAAGASVCSADTSPAVSAAPSAAGAGGDEDEDTEKDVTFSVPRLPELPPDSTGPLFEARCCVMGSYPAHGQPPGVEGMEVGETGEKFLSEGR